MAFDITAAIHGPAEAAQPQAERIRLIPQRQIALVENTTRSPSIAFQRFKKMLLEQPDKM